MPLPRGQGDPGWGGTYPSTINTLYTIARSQPAYFEGNDRDRGYRALMGALGELYGLDIDYYVAVNLSSFRGVVNTLGGVVVDVQVPVLDEGYSTADGRGKLKLYIPPGMTRMNGQDALAYARSRHGSDDFDRAGRQQRVITSVREQSDVESLLQPGVLAGLIKQLKENVKTNIPTQLVPSMLSLAQKVDLDRRENLVLGSSRFVIHCWPDCPIPTRYMLLAKPEAIKQAVQNVFSTTRAQARSISAIRDEGAIVHVLNGQGGPNTKAVNIASNLGTKGMDALVPPLAGGRADSDDVSGTIITFYNGAEEAMPETAARLKRTFKDKERELVYLDDPGSPGRHRDHRRRQDRGAQALGCRGWGPPCGPRQTRRAARQRYLLDDPRAHPSRSCHALVTVGASRGAMRYGGSVTARRWAGGRAGSGCGWRRRDRLPPHRRGLPRGHATGLLGCERRPSHRGGGRAGRLARGLEEAPRGPRS